MNCPYYNSGYCEIASKIANTKALTNESACKVCISLEDAKNVNKVTVSLAANSLNNNNLDDRKKRKEILKQHRKLILDDAASQNQKNKLDRILNGDGVGSQLWKLLEKLGIKHSYSCKCLEWAERMNCWGPEGCKNVSQDIISHIRNSAKSYGWGDISKAIIKSIENGICWKLSILEPYKSLLNEAIRLAEESPKIDILIPISKGSKYNDIELKMTLRSIEKYCSFYDKIIVVGYIPSFLKESEQLQLVSKKEYRAGRSKRVQLKTKWAIENLKISDSFAYWNDDFLMMNYVDIRNIPTYYCGYLSLAEQKNGWKKLKRNTAIQLKKQKLPIRNYELHLPAIIQKEKYIELSDWWENKSNGVLMRSVYFNNWHHNNLVNISDVKLQKRWEKAIYNIEKGSRIAISYGDGALMNGFIDYMCRKFPEKSRFEK